MWNIDTRKTLTLDQIMILLEASKGTPIHMQVLFNVLMGLRKSEINVLKYSDVDYVNRTLTMQRQLGVKQTAGRKILPQDFYKAGDRFEKRIQLQSASDSGLCVWGNSGRKEVVWKTQEQEKTRVSEFGLYLLL